MKINGKRFKNKKNIVNPIADIIKEQYLHKISLICLSKFELSTYITNMKVSNNSNFLTT